MRIWDIDPARLCRQHLLGEHRELHGLWNILTLGKRGYRHHPETRRWQGKLAALHARHEALVAEMARRGYRHGTPLDARLATGGATQEEYVDTPEKQLGILRSKGCECETGTAFERERPGRGATADIQVEGPMSEHEAEEAAAETAAARWLEHIDRGDAEGSWPETSATFQSAVTPELWRSSLERAQAGLGRALERTLDSATYATELPGAPDGEYVVLQYVTRFEHKARGGETVALSRESDGSWKVGGYFVR